MGRREENGGTDCRRHRGLNQRTNMQRRGILIFTHHLALVDERPDDLGRAGRSNLPLHPFQFLFFETE
jgi:hypothetical protein